jgi:hypothetical protein
MFRAGPASGIGYAKCYSRLSLDYIKTRFRLTLLNFLNDPPPPASNHQQISVEPLRHIFVIEDNAGDVLLIRQILQEQQIPVRVHVARDGDQALFMLAEGRFEPDLILLDLNLPKASGIAHKRSE